jgi:hypothetical protein
MATCVKCDHCGRVLADSKSCVPSLDVGYYRCSHGTPWDRGHLAFELCGRCWGELLTVIGKFTDPSGTEPGEKDRA